MVRIISQKLPPFRRRFAELQAPSAQKGLSNFFNMLDFPRCWSMSKGRKASERPQRRAFRIEAPTPFGYRFAGRLVMSISRAKYLQLVE